MADTPETVDLLLALQRSFRETGTTCPPTSAGPYVEAIEPPDDDHDVDYEADAQAHRTYP